MKAVFLTSKSDAYTSFAIREAVIPAIQSGEVLINVKAFGLNYADVMARKGLYPEMPPMPAILGYDVCGEVVEIGEEVSDFKIGDHVTALTRFGGYAEYAVADARACLKLEKGIPSFVKLAMATQLSTAYYAAVECVNLYEGDTILIRAAAGGVGLGILQIALYKKCQIIAVVGSEEKLNFLRSLGVTHTINYKRENITEVLKQKQLYKKIDCVFDSVGGNEVRNLWKALIPGGKYVIFGAAGLSGAGNKLSLILELIRFGSLWFGLSQFLMPSKSMIGINMLAIADHNSKWIERSMKGVYQYYREGIFKYIRGENLPVDKIAEAHDRLEKGDTIGKLAIEW